MVRRLPGSALTSAHESRLGRKCADGNFRSVASAKNLVVPEHIWRDITKLTQALDRDSPDLDIRMFGGTHLDEVPPGPIVPGHDQARLGGVGQHRARSLPG